MAKTHFGNGSKQSILSGVCTEQLCVCEPEAAPNKKALALPMYRMYREQYRMLDE